MKKVVTLLVGIAILTCAANGFADGMLQIKGSDTLINLVQRLSEVYMEKNYGEMLALR